jgi:hypothetical protein
MATQSVIDEIGRSTTWLGVAVLSGSLIVPSGDADILARRPRRAQPRTDVVSLVAEDVAFAPSAAPSGSVFGATVDTPLPALRVLPGPMPDEADGEPLLVEVAAPTIRVRARVRSVDHSTAYEGTAFERGDDES